MDGRIVVKLLVLSIAVGMVLLGASVLGQTPKPGSGSQGSKNNNYGSKTNPVGSGLKPSTGTTAHTATVTGSTVGTASVNGRSTNTVGTSKAGTVGSPKKGTAGGSSIGGGTPAGGGGGNTPGGGGSGGSGGGSGGSAGLITLYLEPNNPTAGYINMVLVPGGSFTWGAPSTEKGYGMHPEGDGTDPNDPLLPEGSDMGGGRGGTSGPEVMAITDFWISKFEISNYEYYKVMGGAEPAAADKDKPKTLTYDEASAFCTKLGQINNAGSRVAVPTTYQWEKACRAPDTSSNNRYYYGENDPQDPLQLYKYAWYLDTSADGTAKAAGAQSGGDFHPWSEVNKRSPNACGTGLYNMMGNVWEWTSTVVVYYDNGNQVPDGRAVKGGSIFTPWNGCRSAAWSVVLKTKKREIYYDGGDPDTGTPNVGLRIVLNSN